MQQHNAAGRSELADRSEFIAALKARLQIGRAAVVAIDMHRGHLDPAVATLPVEPATAERVIQHTRQLFALARGRGVPIVHVVVSHRPLPYPGAESMSNPFWRAAAESGQSLTVGGQARPRRHNLAGSPQAEIVPALAPQPEDYVIATKKRLSSFYGTDLEFVLRQLAVDTVILAGVNTNTCVLYAAFELHTRDYQVVMVPECVASSYGDDLHRFALANVSRCLGWVLTLDELAARLPVGSVAPPGSGAMPGAGPGTGAPGAHGAPDARGAPGAGGAPDARGAPGGGGHGHG